MKKKSFLSLFRLNAVLPLGLGLFVLIVYVQFFLDWHLRFIVERVGTYLVGAEVDVGHLRTRFLRSSLKVKSFAITDPHRLTHNWVEFQEFHVRFSWDGLLRGKMVIPLWEVRGLAFNKARLKHGKVPKHSLGSFLSRSEKALSKQVGAQLKKNPQQNHSSLGDVFSLIKGEDVFEKVSSQLLSKKKVENLEQDINLLDKKWKERIQKLPQESDLKQLYREVKSVNFSNLLQLPKALSKLERILKKGKKKYDLIANAQKDLQKDMSGAHRDLTQVKRWVEQDLKALKSRWQSPKWSAEHLSQQMLMTYLQPYKTKWMPYYQKFQPYLPPFSSRTKASNVTKAKGDKDTSNSKPTRTYPLHRGTLYEFGHPKAYPLLWIQSLKLGLNREDSFKGEIRHISSDFQALGKPLTLSLEGKKLSLPVGSFRMVLAFDPRGESYDSKGSLTLADWQMGENILLSSQDLKLGWKRAKSQLQLDFTMWGSSLNLRGKQTFKSVDYQVHAKDPFLKDFLLSTLKSLPELHMSFQVKGEMDSPHLWVNSNLGRALEKAFVKKIRKEFKKRELRLRRHIEQEVTKNKKQMEQSLGAFHNKHRKEVDRLRRRWDKFLKENSKKLKL